MFRKIDIIVGRIVEKVKAKKMALTSLVVTWGLIGMNTITAHASSISGNLENANNGIQQEALGWVESLGGLGIVVGAICWVTGNTKLAKSVIMGVGIGYMLVKFAPQLWTWFKSVF